MKLLLPITLWSTLVAVSFAGEYDAVDAPGKILFISTREGNAQIQIMNSDGSGQRALTSGVAENTEPVWSPDGKRIAFTSYRDGNAEIYLMDTDGGHQQRLTSHDLADNSPAWTPDGRIIFRSMRDRWSNFYVMDADAANLQQLTTDQMDKGSPLPSPDGQWIAFVVNGDQGNSEIYTMPANGGAVQNLTGQLSKNKKTLPSWSPDSKRLAYIEGKDTVLNIHVIDPTGNNPTKITDDVHTNAYPLWSPDGKSIAFVSTNHEATSTDQARGDIYVMKNDGSAVTNLTHHLDEDNYPAWSADGHSIYFVSLRTGTAQIYQVPTQGGESLRLTHNQGYDVMIRPWIGQALTTQINTANVVTISNIH